MTSQPCAGTLVCDERQACSLGRCTTPACAEEEKLGTTFEGCIFYAAEGENVSSDAGQATSLLVTNPSREVARIDVQARPHPDADWTTFTSASIPPLSAHRVSVHGRQIGAAGITPAGAIRVSSDQPVTVVQIQGDDRDRRATSSAGTVLLPVQVLGQRYRAIGVPQNGQSPVDAIPGSRGGAGRVLVVGVLGPARFRFAPTAPAMVGAIGVEPVLAHDQSRTFELDDGDVFQAFSVNEGDDLTGSEIVVESGTVAAFSGNVSTLYGRSVTGIHSPDSVHEQLLPTASWDTRLVALPLPPQGDTCDTLFGTAGAALWRIVADQDETEVHFSAPPTVTGLPPSPLPLEAGEVAELLVTGGSFFVRASKPIQVVQGLDCEPGLAPAVATGHLLKELWFGVLPGFDQLIGLVRPVGETVSLDDVALPEGLFTSAGGDLETATVRLATCPADQEVCTHHLAGRFGMTLRGMDVVCSYALTAPSWPSCALNPNCVP